jgi:hypothetical protein
MIGTISEPVGIPEPSAMWLPTIAMAALCTLRRHSRIEVELNG